MKKFAQFNLLMISILLFTASASCTSWQSPFSVKGSGELTDKNYEVSGFHAIEVSGGFDVNLIQGNDEAVTITAEDNLFEHIRVKVEGGVLRIYVERGAWVRKEMKAKISFKSIDRLSVSGGGDVTSGTDLNVPKLAVELSGGGDIKTTVKTGDLRCNISGGGDAEIRGTIESYDLNLSGGGDVNSEISSGNIACTTTGGGDITIKNNRKAKEVEVSISGGGDIHLTTDAEEVRCSVSGGGDATLSGKANDLEIDVNGGGDFDANNFEAEKVRFTANGGSDVRIRASAEINGNISGGGNVFYSGNAGTVNIDAKGGSTVHKQ